MSTFSGSTNTGIVLGTGAYTNPLTITSTGYVANTTGAVSGDAVFGPTGTAWTLINYGTVNGTDPSQPAASGVHLLSGGFVANEALVTGNAQGVRIDGAAGMVSNLGTIAAAGAAGRGVYLSAGGTVYNGGPAYPSSVITGYDGIRIAGGVGTLINYAKIAGSGVLGKAVYLGLGGYVSNSGLLTSPHDVIDIEGGAGTVENSGTILATGIGAGVWANAGGTISNTGFISGLGNGVFGNNGYGTVFNSGTISDPGTTGDGVCLEGGGYVTNGVTGLIVGPDAGIEIQTAVATVANSGTIAATGAYRLGIDLLVGGTVTNDASGLVDGDLHGVIIFGTYGTVTNLGTIQASHPTAFLNRSTAVQLVKGGVVVNGDATHPGALINGANYAQGVYTGGYNAIEYTNAAATVTNFGTIASARLSAVVEGDGGTVANYGTLIGVSGGVFFMGGLVTNAAGALIQGSGSGQAIFVFPPANASFNGGVFTTVINAGTIAGAGATAKGIVLNEGGTVNNTGTILAGGDGILADRAAGTVVNSGIVAVTGASGVGVDFLAGGTVTNAGSIAGVGNGVIIAGTAGTVANLGTVSATGAFGASVYLAAGGTVTNGAATVTSALIVGNSNALAIFNVPGNVTNYGTIAAIGTAGYGVVISELGTVSNSGTIARTGTAGAAVRLGAGGSIANSGLISGGGLGVQVVGAAGTLVNSGTIAALGLVTNAGGSIIAGDAVYLNKGGILTNSAGGLIEGYHVGVLSGGAASTTVVNVGTITAVQAVSNGNPGGAIQASGGGLVTNSGLIQADEGNGVITGSSAGGVGTIVNLGVIRTTGTLLGPTGGHMNPIGMLAGGTIINGAPTSTSALITGYERAIYGGGANNVPIAGAVITLVNYGTISGTGTGTAVTTTDVSLRAGAVVTNHGLISSGTQNAISIGTTSFASTGTISNFGTVVTGGSPVSAIYLAAGGYIGNQVGGQIISSWTGITARNAAATVTNLGTIASSGSTLDQGTFHATGILLAQGGTVINSGLNGLIIGYEHAVYIGGSGGTANPGAVGVVFNYDTISGTGTGAVATQTLVLSSGGTVTNFGTITSAAHNAVETRGSVATTVINSGLIKNFTTAHSAVYSAAGGVVANIGSGTIASGRSAISFNDTAGTTVSFGTVLNAARIQSTGTTAGSGVYFGQRGILTNLASGLITAIRSGVSGGASAATVANYGTITSTGSTSCGVELAGGGSVLNGATGLISGATGVAITGTAPGTVSNFGTISGVALNGVTLAGGGVVGNGYATIIGAARGVGGGSAAGSDALIKGAAVGVSIAGGTTVGGAVVNFASITGGTGGVAFLTNGTVSNDTAGFIAGGYGIGTGTGAIASAIYNFGTIIGTASRGIRVTSGGTISNGAGGLIAGFTNGVYASATGLAVTNSGAIFSSSGAGIRFGAGGTLNNGGSIAGAGGGAYFFGAAGALTNGGTIASTSTLFDGVYMGSGGVINNGGLIAGLDGIDLHGSGSIGNSGTIVGFGSGNVGGIFAGFNYAPGAVSVTNTGLITSTATAILLRGAGAVTNAPGGVITGSEFAVQAFGALTIVNFGTIASAAGSAGTAIRLGATPDLVIGPGADLVVIEQGSVLTGAIANFGAGDTIDLPFIPFSAGDTATIDSNNVLTVNGGGKVATVQLDSSVAVKLFTVVNDGSGGAGVQLTGPAAPSVLALAGASDSGVKGDNITNIATPTITGKGEAGDTVTLLDGVTVVGTATVLADLTWSVASKTLSPGVHSLTATEKDASALVSFPSSILSITIDQSAPAASPAKLTVPNNGGPTAIGILAPSDPDDSAASLSIIVSTLPANGTVTLADGATPVTVGEALSIAQLTTLKFAPAAGQIGISSNFVYSITDVAGNATTGSAALTVGGNSVTSLFDFLFTYKDGKDYYGGSVADDGTFAYAVGQTIATSAGTYTIFAKEGSVTSQAPGTVFVAAYSHNGPGAASQIPITTASGKPDGSAGLGSEGDAVLGVDGKAHPFSSTVEANFPTTNLFGFVYTYADGAAFYTGSVADDGSAGLADGSLPVTDGSGHLIGTYTIFSEGVTGRAAGTVVIDRFMASGSSFVAVHANSSGIDGIAGLKSEAATIVAQTVSLVFSDTVEPVVPGGLAIAPVPPAPNSSDVITQELNEIYHGVLGRDPDPTGLALFSAQLASGTSAVTIRATLAGSAEAQHDINQLYRQLLGHDADSAGLSTYTTYLATGGSLAGIQLTLAQSSEAQNAIQQLYLDVLNRPADPSGLAADMTMLGNETPDHLADPGGRAGLDGLRDIIAHSPQAADSLTALFQSVLGRPPGAAELIGLEDQLAMAGVTQTTLKNALLGTAGAATTAAAAGFSVVTAPAGDATLPAAFGVPTLFVFADLTFGRDAITGFDPTRDTIQLAKATVSDFTTLQSETTSSGGGSLITLNASQSILISGITPASLGTANFRFA